LLIFLGWASPPKRTNSKHTLKNEPEEEQMKKTIFAVFLALAAAVSSVEARTLEEIKASGTIKIATEGATPPFNFYEGDQLKGFDIDLGNALGEKIGVKVEWLSLPFDTLLVGLDQDRFDLVSAGHGITEERRKAVDFTTPYICSGAAVVSMKGGATKVAEIADKIVGVQVGTTYFDGVTKLGIAKDVKTFPKDTDAMQNLLSKRIDIWVSDRLTVLYVIQQNPAAKEFQVGELLYSEEQGIAVKKGNAGLLTAVNGALASTLSDGTYEAISKKWVGQDVRCAP
jgi:polar amino acid transport system substrate-binding protein